MFQGICRLKEYSESSTCYISGRYQSPYTFQYRRCSHLLRRCSRRFLADDSLWGRHRSGRKPQSAPTLQWDSKNSRIPPPAPARRTRRCRTGTPKRRDIRTPRPIASRTTERAIETFVKSTYDGIPDRKTTMIWKECNDDALNVKRTENKERKTKPDVNYKNNCCLHAGAKLKHLKGERVNRWRARKPSM